MMLFHAILALCWYMFLSSANKSNRHQCVACVSCVFGRLEICLSLFLVDV